MYPIKFTSIIKEMIWGSESWDITCRPNEMGVIENGEFAGETCEWLCKKDRAAVIGKNFAGIERFPLLVKIINVRDSLSVQVHPSDEYALANGETDTGKSELWYVLKPPADGHLIIGLKQGITREKLSDACKNGTVENCLNRRKVRRGDIIEIPAGLVHALTPGTVVAEIQQNSDITYRLYDFGRIGVDGMPRKLHVNDALNVIDCENSAIEHFTVEKQEISAQISVVSDVNAFSIYTCVEGSAIFETPTHVVPLETARSVFIPAKLGAYIIRPQGNEAALLKTTPITNFCTD
ncbi:MAG: class I mannose-6-phosphate isomerase [Clostridiales bacterium]|jgi:mannose-6-phosphate isomerase|nr:class I mannose-6-phosphate isomerase [Clostridiales bacterium]